MNHLLVQKATKFLREIELFDFYQTLISRDYFLFYAASDCVGVNDWRCEGLRLMVFEWGWVGIRQNTHFLIKSAD